MLLVVVGHMSRPTLFHGQTVWPGLEWYGLLHDWIYLFHMPFFMFATGFLLFRTYKPPSDVGQYLGLVGRRVHRILPGYFIYGLAALAGKLLLSHTNVATVEGTPSSAWSGFVDLLTCPVDGPATQLWYLYVLLIYSIFLPAVFKAVGRGLAILLPIALVLHFVPAGKFLAADQVCEYLFVLILGCLAAKHYDVFRRWAGKLALLWLAIFVAAFFVLPTDDDN
jgi:fucose 4-O-acetylase-like acetyltransferase